MAYTIAGQPYDQAGWDFVSDYANRLGYANMEQFVYAQIASGLETQAFSYARMHELGASTLPAQQAMPYITMFMATMTHMQMFQGM